MITPQIKSVWYLKKFVMESDGELIPSVTYDYGFFNCKTEAERMTLHTNGIL